MVGKKAEGGDSKGFQSADWRGGASTPSPAHPPRRHASVQHDRFHARSRPAGLAKERERAREIVSAARAVVTTTFADIRFGRRIDVAALEPVVAGIAASIARHPGALPSVTRLKEAHEYTYLHSVAVCGLMIGLARELNLPPALLHDIGLAGLLHDIGKAKVPVELLDKPGPLDFAEYALVQQHTTRGRELLEDAGVISPIALDVCLHHHERADGAGYPAGLPLPAISIHARMGAVCDVYDAVTSRRAYKDSWTPGEALEWMAGSTGFFDPHVMRTFRRMIGAFPIGSLVRLESQRLAVVIDDPEGEGASPDVVVFLCASSRRPLGPVRIGTARDPILGIELSGRWNLDDWDTRRAEMLRTFAPGAGAG